MAKKGNQPKVSNQTEKVVTKYDLKKKKREEEAKRDRRNSLIARIAAILIVAVIVIGSAIGLTTRYIRINKEYIVVNGESVSEIEFDLYYGITKSNMINSYGTYLSYIYGYDSSTSDKLQNYSEEQTWYDYFASIAIETIKANKALLQIADERNYDYTAYEDDLAEFKEDVQSAAEESSLTVDEYYSKNFGSVVTEKKVEKYLYNYCKANAIRDVLTEELAATDSEIDSYYSQNKNSYDTFSYRSLEIAASDASDTTAMSAAKSKADEMNSKVTDEASFIQLCTEYAEDADDYKNDSSLSLTTDYTYAASGETLDEWLADASRAAGDKTVIEDTSAGTYTVVYFVSRTSGKEDNEETIAQTVLSDKYAEYIGEYTDTMTVDTKKRIVQVEE